MSARTGSVAAFLASFIGLLGVARGDGTADPVVLAQLEAARALAADVGDSIWPGFDLRKIPIAVFTPGASAIAIQTRTAPDGYSPVDTPLVSAPVLLGKTTDAMNANTSGPLGNDVAAFIGRASLSTGGVTAGDLALLFHECGHAFRQRAPEGGAARWRAENSAEVASYPDADPTNNAWGRIEGRLLHDALLCHDPVESRRIANDFLAVRTRRQSALPPAVAEFERRLELNEGLAEYFGECAVMLAAGRPGMPSDCGRDGRWFAGFLDRLAHVNVGGRGAARDRFYSTGSAQALLLDSFTTAWKENIEERSVSLQELLAAAIPFDPATARATSDAVAKRLGFDALLKEEERATRASQARKRSRFLAVAGTPGKKLVLDLTHAGGADDVRSFDPMNLTAIAPDLKVHTRMSECAFTGGGAKFGVPAVQDSAHGRWIVALPDGVHVEEHGIHGDGLAIDWRRAAVATDGDVTVVVPEADDVDAATTAAARAFVADARAEAALPVPAAPFSVTDLAGNAWSQPEESPRETTLVFVSAASWAKPAHAFVKRLTSLLEDRPRATAERRLLIVFSRCDRAEVDALLGDAPRAGIVHDADGWLVTQFDAADFPSVVRIGADGNIASRCTGNSGATLDAALDGFE